MAINILLADDHTVISDGIKMLIHSFLPDAHIAQAGTMEATIKYLKTKETQLVICDINMPGANNLGMVQIIKSIQPRTKLLMLTAYSPRIYAHRYLREGADAYLSKNAETEKIKTVVLGLLAGKSHFPVDKEADYYAAGHTEESSPHKLLSNRELEVAQLLIQGSGILEISNLLHIHVNTVSTYKTRIFEKMNVLSIPELIEVFRDYAIAGS